MTKKKGGLAFLLGSILAMFLLVGVMATTRFSFLKKAEEIRPGQVTCVSAQDPYNSNQIIITVPTNYPGGQVEFNPYVFRCEYKPGRLAQYHGSYKCEGGNNPCPNHEPSCFVGTWDDPAADDFILKPGEQKTLTLTSKPCEIAQLDVYNPIEHSGPDLSECWNPSSQYTNPPPPAYWPGGVAFAIKENATGYNATTGTCNVTPTTPPTVPPTVPPSVPPSPTPTRQPTAPPGQPSYTPIPTIPPTRAPTTIVIYPTSPVQPTRPVAGNMPVTVMTVLGGIGLIVLSLL
jgi:hypothetical protein